MTTTATTQSATRRAAKVLPFPARIPSRRHEIQWENVWQMTRLLHEEFSNRYAAGETISSMAAKMKVSAHTVSRFVHDESRDPKAGTILAALRFLGYGVYIR